MKNKLSLLAIATSICLSSCKDDNKNPQQPAGPVNTVEIITTAKLLLTETGTGNTITASWKDADGDGPGQPIVSGLTLAASKEYQGRVVLLDESKTPVDTISTEVEEEKDVHQFFYTLNGNTNGRIVIDKTDKDDNNLPVGLEIRLTTSAGPAVSGALNITLKHYDGVVKSADPAIGETDLEIELPVTIQ